jgi:hypothetical protein
MPSYKRSTLTVTAKGFPFTIRLYFVAFETVF